MSRLCINGVNYLILAIFTAYFRFLKNTFQAVDNIFIYFTKLLEREAIGSNTLQ